MPSQCVIDAETSPTFLRDIKALAKKYPKVKKDLHDAIAKIEVDYTMACFAVANAGFKRLVWEYSYGSTDLRRDPRRSFRVIGAFLGEQEGGTMYFILTFFKGDKPSEDNETIRRAMARITPSEGSGSL